MPGDFPRVRRPDEQAAREHADALFAETEAERIASRGTVRESYLQHVGRRLTELPLDAGEEMRKYGMGRADAIVEAVKLVIARLRPHVESAVREETHRRRARVHDAGGSRGRRPERGARQLARALAHAEEALGSATACA